VFKFRTRGRLRDQALNLELRVKGLGLRGLDFEAFRLGFETMLSSPFPPTEVGFEFRSGSRVQGLGFRVEGLGG